MSVPSTNSSPSLQSNEVMPSCNSRTGLALAIRTILTAVILGGWTYGCHWIFGIFVTFLTFGGGKALIGISSLGILMGGLMTLYLLRFVWKKHSSRPPPLLDQQQEEASTTPWTDACACQTFRDMSRPELRKLSFRLVFVLHIWGFSIFGLFVLYLPLLNENGTSSRLLETWVLSVGFSSVILIGTALFHRHAFPSNGGDGESFFLLPEDLSEIPASLSVSLLSGRHDEEGAPTATLADAGKANYRDVENL